MLTNNQSLVLTVHDKEFLINDVLQGIKDKTVGTYELIVVLDGCNDKTPELVHKFKGANPEMKIKIAETPDVFETKANNAGLRLVESDLAIIIQDDMVMTEAGWNDRLTKPFRTFDDVFGVTAQCAHNWELNPNSKHIHTDVNNNYEWSDILNHIEHANKATIDRDTFAVRQCVNRGPLALNYSDMVSLDFFDESFAPQDMDDHDLCFRMQEKIGKVVGCYWIDYKCDPNWGGTRVDGKPASWVLEANQRNSRVVLVRHKDRILNKIIDNRNC